MALCMKIKWKSCVPRHWEMGSRRCSDSNECNESWSIDFGVFFDTENTTAVSEKKNAICHPSKMCRCTIENHLSMYFRNGKRNIILYLKWRIIELLSQIYTKYTLFAVFLLSLRVYVFVCIGCTFILCSQVSPLILCIYWDIVFAICHCRVSLLWFGRLPFSMDHSLILYCIAIVLPRILFAFVAILVASAPPRSLSIAFNIMLIVMCLSISMISWVCTHIVSRELLVLKLRQQQQTKKTIVYSVLCLRKIRFLQNTNFNP